MNEINPHDPALLANRWRTWATVVETLSPTYARFARRLADNHDLVNWLAKFPCEKHIPNLLLAAVRFHHGLADSPDAFINFVQEDRVRLGQTLMARGVQTNESARLAPILPLLSEIQSDSGKPLALIEVGASAGLCLMPDYCYFDYGSFQLDPTRDAGTAAPTVTSAVTGALDPFSMPHIGWRMGLELEPVDLDRHANADWLEALVFPEHQDRVERLRAAIALKRAVHPPIEQGDLRSDLARVIAQVPEGMIPVVFHTIVLFYLRDHHEAERFGQQVWDLGAHWIAAETADTLPKHACGLKLPEGESAVVVAHNSHPRAIAHPHGAWMQWL